MVEFLKLIIKELPVGYSLLFQLQNGFSGDPLDKGLVVVIRIKSSMGLIGEFKITRDFITDAESKVVEMMILDKIREWIKKNL